MMHKYLNKYKCYFARREKMWKENPNVYTNELKSGEFGKEAP